MRRTLTAVLAVGVLAMGGCGTGGGSGAASATLTLAVSKINATLDPVEPLTTSYLRSFGVGESLAKIRPDGTVAPELAESLTRTAPDTWTVVLRPGAVFHSGAPVDAEAVRSSLARSAAENELAANLLKGLTVAVVDPRTVTVRAAGPAPFLDFTLAHYELQIHKAASDLTGPYRVTAFTPDRELTLQRNDRWWGPAPQITTVTVQQVADPSARAQIALAGQADIADLLPSSAVPQLRAGEGTTLVGAPAANTVAVYLNPRSAAAPALADQRVRQALAWGIDRTAVAQIAGEGLTEAAPSWLASNPGFPQADQQGFTRFDPTRAGQLLDEAGWRAGPDGRRAKDGQPLAFRLQTWGTEGPTGEVLQAQWNALGVTVELSYVDNTLVQQARQRGDWDAQTAAFTTLGNVPALLAVQLGADGSGNFGHYEVPGVQDLIRQAESAADEQARTAAILRINELHAEIVPSIPVHPRPQATAVSARVTGFVPHPLQYENLVQPGYTLAD